MNTDYMIWQEHLIAYSLACFDQKVYTCKYTFKAKIDIFLTFMLINFLVWTHNTTYKNFNFVFVFLIEIWKTHPKI